MWSLLVNLSALALAGDTVQERRVVVEFEASEGVGAPVAAPVVTVAVGEAAPWTLALADDGKSPDPMAGDGRWAGTANTATGVLTVCLYDAVVSGAALICQPVTLTASGGPMQVRLSQTPAGFLVDAAAASAAPPVERSPAGGVGVTPPPARDAPVTAGEAANAMAGWLAALAGILASGVIVAFSAHYWRTRARPIPLGQRADGRVAGLPALDGGVVAWIVPDPDVRAILVFALDELRDAGPILVLPRAASRPALAARASASTYEMRSRRPGAAAVLRAARGLRAAMLVEGAGALEEALAGEAEGAVVSELVAGAKQPLLLVLRADEAIPERARVVRFARHGTVLMAENIALEADRGGLRIAVGPPHSPA